MTTHELHLNDGEIRFLLHCADRFDADNEGFRSWAVLYLKFLREKLSSELPENGNSYAPRQHTFPATDDISTHRCSDDHPPCPACELREEREYEREAGL